MPSFQSWVSSRQRFRDYLTKYRADLKSGRPVGDPNRPGGGDGSRRGLRSLPKLYHELYRYAAGYRTSIILALMGLTMATLLKLIPPAATKMAIDYILPPRKPIPEWFQASIPFPIPDSPRIRLVALVAFMGVVAVVGVMIAIFSRWSATRASKRIQADMRRRAYEHAMRLPLHRVYQLKSGGATSLLREDAGGVGELVFSMLYNPWRAFVQFIGGLVVLAWVDWRLLLGALALTPGVYITDHTWNRRIRPLFREVRRRRQEMDSQTTEVFGGMRIVRAFGRQQSESTRFVNESHMMTRLDLHVWWLSRIVELVWEFLLPGASIALLLYGGLRVLNGELTLGDLSMFMVYLAMLLEPLAVLATSVTQLQNNLSGFERVLDLLEEPREMAEAPGTIKVVKARTAGQIQIDDVNFAYPAGDRLVLRGINLEVEPGETIALVGRSGSGKSTLCNLIARFYDPTTGAIRIDGIDLREIEVESYRQLLGIVEQDVFLFDGSIAQNIAYGDRSATMARLREAARVANAAEFIEQLPEGYETLIGERGIRLSGGQRQRLAIARAVLANPRVFILDEATSSLDSESERLIQKSLTEILRDRTSFVIAHRLSTIRHADRILVMQEGEIVEVGNHEELIASSGLYRDMVELQRLERGDGIGLTP